MTTQDRAGVPMSMVLLEDAGLPDPQVFIDAAEAFGMGALTREAGDGPQAYLLPGGGTLLLMCIDAPHPDAAGMPRIVTAPSVDAVASARAHMILTVMGCDRPTRERDALMARLTGALCDAMPTIGGMLGHGIAFHRSDLFANMARALQPGDTPVWLSIDITLAPEEDGRVSALTHGMPRYGREDFYVLGIPDQARDAFDVARMLSTWMVTSDKQLPTGDTVGRTADEKLIVQRRTNPTDPDATVVMIELLPT